MNYELVKWTISALEQNWDVDTYPGYYKHADVGPARIPAIINQNDARERESGTRSQSFDLSENNAVTVGSGGAATVDPIGTEFDHRLEEIVSLRIEGVHESEWGHISNEQEFSYLVRAARNAVLADRVWPYRNPSGPRHYHSVFIDNQENLTPDNKDYFRYDIDFRFEGYEEIPVTTGYGTDYGEDYGSPEGYGSDYGDNYNY